MSKATTESGATLEGLIEEYLERLRRGESPSPSEYARKYPDLAEQIDQVFPALGLVEAFKPEISDATGDAGPDRERNRASGAAVPERVGDYHILREIGRGGMGIVYEAEQISLGRRVALKVLARQLTRDERLLERFRREARAAARLHHTNIVPVFEVGHEGDFVFYAMQYIQGQGLDLVIAELRRMRGSSAPQAPDPSAAAMARTMLTGYGPAGPNPSGGTAASSSVVLPGGTHITAVDSGRRSSYFRSVAHVGFQAAGALAHAHARGVIHRDVKPSNLLLDTTGTVWVADFGLAKADDDGLTQSGDLLGTLRYMAPERFRGEGDARADVYALGLTLYELLVLHPAFDSPDRIRLIEQIRTEEPPRPRSIDPRVPLDLETVVLKAIDKDPRRRYGRADDLAEDLRRYVEGEPILARRTSETEKVWKWAMRHQALAGLLVLLLLVLALGAIVSTTLALRARARESEARASLRRETAARLAANRTARDALFERARVDGEAGRPLEAAYGVLAALAKAPESTPEDRALRAALLRNLAAYRAELPIVRYVAEDPHVSDDGGSLIPTGPEWTGLIRIGAGRLIREDLATGTPRSNVAWPEAERPAAATADGTLLCTYEPAHGDRLRIREATTGQLVATFPESAHARRARFSPDQRYVLPLEGTQLERCYRLDRQAGTVTPVGPELREITHSVDAVTFFPDRRGHMLLVVAPHRLAATDHLRVHDLDADQPVDHWELDPRAALSPSPPFPRVSAFDGEHLVTLHGYGRVRWWDAAGASAQRAWQILSLQGVEPVQADLTADGRFLVALGGDGAVRWFDLATRQACGSAFALAGAGGHAFSPLGDLVVARAPGRVGIWQAPRPPQPAADAATMTPRALSGVVDFRTDGQAALLSSAQLNGSGMGRLTPRVAQPTSTFGRQIDPASGAPIGPPLAPWGRLAVYSGDGARIAATRNEVFRRNWIESTLVGAWDARTGRSLMPLVVPPQWVHALQFSPDGRTLAIGEIAAIQLVEVSSGRTLHFLPTPGPIARLEFSPDGRVLAAGARQGWGATPGVELWDVTRGQAIGKRHETANLPYFIFDPSGTTLAVADPVGRTAFSVKVATGARWGNAFRTASTPGGDGANRTSDRATAVAFRGDARVLTEAVGTDIRRFDMTSGRAIGPVLRNSAPVFFLADQPEGQLFASGTFDGQVQLWDAAAGLPIGPPRRLGMFLIGLTFTPDGRAVRAVTRAGDVQDIAVPPVPETGNLKTLRLWLEAGSGLRQLEDGVIVALSASELTAVRDHLASSSGSVLPTAPPLAHVMADWHAAGALEAHRLERRVPERWHLERLAALRPGDWTLAARLGDSFTRDGETSAAEATCTRAAQLAPAEALADWFWNGALAFLDEGRPELARAYLDRAVSGRGQDWRLHVNRADVLDRLGLSAESEAAEDRAWELGADRALFGDFAMRAVLRNRTGRLKTLCEREILPPEIQAPVAAACGDTARFRAAAAVILRDLGQAPEPTAVLDAVETVGLGPAAPGDLATALRLVARVGHDKPSRYTYELCRARAALELRSGRASEALATLVRTLPAHETHRDALVLKSIVLARLNRGPEARRQLDAALAEVEARGPDWPMAWGKDWLALLRFRILRREAEASLLDAVFPPNAFAR
jgi:serine/threonine protein kinase/WD40 repeat protein